MKAEMFFHENYLCSPSSSRTWADVSIQISSLRLLFCYLYPKKSRYMKMKTFVNIFCRDSFRHKSWGGNINSAAYESAYIAWVSLHFAVLHKSDTDSVCIKTCKNSPCKIVFDYINLSAKSSSFKLFIKTLRCRSFFDENILSWESR